MSRSGLTRKGIICHAGVINPDYTGNITDLLYNSTNRPFSVKTGDHITQIIFNRVSMPCLIKNNIIPTTDRSDNGFGSTDGPASIRSNMHTPISPQTNIIVQQSPITSTIPDTQPTVCSVTLPEMPYNIYLSYDPFDDVIPITVADFRSHPTLGMILQPLHPKPTTID